MGRRFGKGCIVLFFVGALFFLLVGQISEAQSRFDSIRPDDIKAARLSSARIPGNSLTPNTIIIFSTNEGRFGKLLIKSCDYNLNLAWVTFNADGTVYSRGDSLVVRGTFTCDLDAGREARDSADFWWQMVTQTESYLTPQNGATFAIYSPALQPLNQPTTTQRTETTQVDTSQKRTEAESTRTGEAAGRVKLSDRLSQIIKKAEKPQIDQVRPATSEPPASFQNVRYRFKSNVRVLKANFNENLKVAEEVLQQKMVQVRPVEKLVQGALIRSGVIEDQLKTINQGQQSEIGMIIYDETTKLAGKVISKATIQNRDYYVMTRPQLHEVLDEFEIPQQTVTLTSGNITPLTPPEVKIHYFPQQKAKTYSLPFGSDYKWHIKDPLLVYEFEDVEVWGIHGQGVDISVRITGHIGISPINVSLKWTCFDGYDLNINTGEEINLKVTFTSKIDRDLIIPLAAIDVPGGIAQVKGGLYLLIGADGKFRLTAEATEWLGAAAGIRGGTFLYIPTGCDPYSDFYKGFESDVNFTGHLNGYIKVGPLADLDICGWSLVGAGFMVGLGLESSIRGSLIKKDEVFMDFKLYGSLELFIVVFDKRFNLINNKYMLYQIQKPYTADYEIIFYDACAWRNSIWGSIKKLDDNGDLKPVNKPLTLKLYRKEGNIELYKETNSNTEGFFKVQFDIPLRMGDEIKVIKVDKETVTSDAISPTFPFSDIRLEYADFFNNKAFGQVTAARVKNWDTGEWEDIAYTGDVFSNYGTRARCDKEGNFILSYDFRPGQEVQASIDFNGFKLYSPIVKTDVVLVGTRLIEPGVISEYTDSSGRPVDKRVEKENFIINNPRGEKQVTFPVVYQARYLRYYALSHAYEYFSGKPIKSPDILGERSYSFRPAPAGPGGSVIAKDFVEEWSWLPERSGVSTGVLQIDRNLQSITTKPQPQFVSLSEPYFRYDSNKSKAQRNPLEDTVKAIYRDGYLVFSYEGAEIEIQELNGAKAHEGQEPPRTGLNPGQQALVDRIDSRINPSRISRIDPISSRVNIPLNKIRIISNERR